MFNLGRGTGCSQCGAPVHIGTLCYSCWQAAQGKGTGPRGNSFANGACAPADRDRLPRAARTRGNNRRVNT